jgi:hypothetical protein
VCAVNYELARRLLKLASDAVDALAVGEVE